uniref:Uncharacterized protein n=1 Tax=Steinernema glaseri TaxID=37863 RepID=A0A1I7Z6V2_9BILA
MGLTPPRTTNPSPVVSALSDFPPATVTRPTTVCLSGCALLSTSRDSRRVSAATALLECSTTAFFGHFSGEWKQGCRGVWSPEYLCFDDGGDSPAGAAASGPLLLNDSVFSGIPSIGCPASNGDDDSVVLQRSIAQLGQRTAGYYNAAGNSNDRVRGGGFGGKTDPYPVEIKRPVSSLTSAESNVALKLAREKIRQIPEIPESLQRKKLLSRILESRSHFLDQTRRNIS